MTSYWICQLTGWGLLTLIKLIAAVEVDRFPWVSTTVWLLLVHAAGLGLTHALRGYMRRQHWSEARRVDRFQQVVERVDFESAYGVLIVRGGEDNLR